jgi:manganese/zinc/iron transport system substrate-binding protein
MTGAGRVAVLVIVAAAALAGCGAPAPTEGARPLVVATTGIVGDTVGRIGGDRIEVYALMGPGVDPHLYKASEGDVRRLDAASIVFYSGLHLEGKMGDILVKMARRKPVVALADEVPEDKRREPPEFAGQYDPHVWFDVSLWALGTDAIARELSALDPAHAGGYGDAAARYRKELDELDRWVSEQIASLPPERRVLVTAHDAFGYFGRRYGMEVVSIQGISTVAEAGLRDLERVVDLVATRRIPAIFVESSVPRRSIEAVQAACRQRGHDVRIGGELYSDALGTAGSDAGTYVGMVRENVETIVSALRGGGATE